MHRYLIPVGAMLGAASYLNREWGENRSIAFTGHSFVSGESPERTTWFVFQCGASDGSRWFICADRYENAAAAHADSIEDLERKVRVDG